MRTVERCSVPCPRIFEDKDRINRAVNAYSTAKKVDSSIYREEEVVLRLKSLFYGKCVFCESDAAKSGVVEHFLPHHPERPERAYDWNNLNWACDKCNNRKTRKIFKELEGQIVTKMLLIDPTAPDGNPVEEMLSFDTELTASATGKYQADQVVQRTADFLNDPHPLQDRNHSYRCMTDLLLAESEAFSNLKTLGPSETLSPSAPPNLHRAFWLADRLFAMFLRDSQPHCSSMRAVLDGRIGISVETVRNLGRQYRQAKSLAQVY